MFIATYIYFKKFFYKHKVFFISITTIKKLEVKKFKLEFFILKDFILFTTYKNFLWRC